MTKTATLTPTTRTNPCPVCGNTKGNCRDRGDGLILCMSHHEQLPGWAYRGETKDGLWGQYVAGEDAQVYEPRAQPPVELAPELSPAEWNKHYKALLGSGVLSEEHGRELRQRLTVAGLDPDAALKGIHGFSTVYGFGGQQSDGYVIPFKDIDGLYVGSQIRLTGDVEGGRYRWYTGMKGREYTKHINGEVPLAVWHPMRSGEDSDRAVVLAEGTGTKPFITAQKLGVIAIGASGGMFTCETLKKNLAALKLPEVWIAVDAGAVKNPHVTNHYEKAQKLAEEMGIHVFYLWWGQVDKSDGDIDEVLDPDIKHLPPKEFWKLVKQYRDIQDSAGELDFLAKCWLDSNSASERSLIEAKARKLGITSKNFDRLTNSLRPVSAVNLESVSDVGLRRYEQVEKIATTGIRPGLMSGFAQLDSMTAGFQDGELVIVAGRPSMGKSTFSINLAKNIAEVYGKCSLFYSLEVSKESIVDKIWSGQGSLHSQSLRSGRLTDRDWGALHDSIGALADLPLYIDDNCDVTSKQIADSAKAFAKTHELGAIFIDYLQLVDDGGSDETRELTRITRRFKKVANQLRVPVFLLSQLNRSVESRNDKRPLMSDLRSSGSIEQDADMVLMLYRDEYYNPDSCERGIAEVLMRKNRNGPLGTAKLLFDPAYSLFKNGVVGSGIG